MYVQVKLYISYPRRKKIATKNFKKRAVSEPWYLQRHPLVHFNFR